MRSVAGRTALVALGLVASISCSGDGTGMAPSITSAAPATTDSALEVFTAATVTSVSPENAQPPGVDIDAEQRIPLRVLAVRPNNPSVAVIDLEQLRTVVYQAGEHALPSDAVGGAVATPEGDWIIWTNGIARLFRGTLGSVTVELGPQERRMVPGVAPALRAVAAPSADQVWLIQPGIDSAEPYHPTLVELVDIDTSTVVFQGELDVRAFPVGTTKAGVVLNTQMLGNHDESGGTAVHLSDDGSVTEVGQGLAVGVGFSRLARLVCPEDRVACNVHRDINRLVVSGLDGGDPKEVSKPFEGTWQTVGGPGIPIGAMPLQTVSPEGSELLIGLGQDLDVNGTPARSVVLIVDLADATTRQVAEFTGRVPLGTWSSDGKWIALMSDNDLRMVNVASPGMTMDVLDVIPEEHFPIAAG